MMKVNVGQLIGLVQANTLLLLFHQNPRKKMINRML